MLKSTLSKVLTMALMFVFIGCSDKKEQSGIYKNNEISKNEKEIIAQLNQQLVSSIYKNDIEGLKTILSDSLIEQIDATSSELLLKVKGIMKSDAYKILDEYLIINNKPRLKTIVTKDEIGDSSYSLDFLALNEEVYASLLILQSDEVDLLVTAIYGKYEDTWKLNILNFGQYALYGKTAPEYFKLSKQNFAESNFADLTINLRLLNECMTPSGEYFNYRFTNDAIAFSDSVMNQLNDQFKFPIVMNSIASKPELVSFTVDMLDKQPIPAIIYTTKINLKDSIKLNEEYLQIREQVAKLYKGIDKTKKAVLYRAFNELPKDGNRVNYKDFIDH